MMAKTIPLLFLEFPYAFQQLFFTLRLCLNINIFISPAVPSPCEMRLILAPLDIYLFSLDEPLDLPDTLFFDTLSETLHFTSCPCCHHQFLYFVILSILSGFPPL